MQWVDIAETYAGDQGWGARGKQIGISRMLNDSDITNLMNSQYVAALRPRGIISGFLVVVPGTSSFVYLPPVAAKMGPQQIQTRLSTTVKEKGALFSAYMTRDQEGARTLIIEDVLVWNDKPVWYYNSFPERWAHLNEFFDQHFIHDTRLQKCTIQPQTYMALQNVGNTEPTAKQVVEFTPIIKGQKRYIWMPPRVEERTTEEPLTVRKEVGSGPDVYIVYKGATRMGQALVRTLAISKALRTAVPSVDSSAAVQAVFNKQFEKWDIQEVALNNSI